jgi:hypothetical protein
MKMCEFIQFPEGEEVYSISNDEEGELQCLCCNTPKEILQYIAEQLPEIQIDEKLIVTREPEGWYVEIKDVRELSE